MSKVPVLIQIAAPQREDAFSEYGVAIESEIESVRQSESLLANLAGYGIELVENYPPVPMFSEQTIADEESGLSNFATESESPDVPAASMVVSALVEISLIEALNSRPEVQVWPNSEYTYADEQTETSQDSELPTVSLAEATVDCEPFRAAVPISVIQELLGAERVWSQGFRGQNVVVGIIDSGINGQVYPVIGGFSTVAGFPIGRAAITSHGSMCAADVLVAAPEAKFFDYPFIGIPNSGGALAAFQVVLSHRRLQGKPHIISNSHTLTERPPRNLNPFHEVWNINNVVHQKVREVVASGATVFFAAGNCGAQCPQPECTPSAIGPGASIIGSNSLREVITVAAVNSSHERPGYSAQGPGGFEPAKPDVSAYTHFFGNFGPGRPGGTAVRPFDRGTSAATPLAAGVAALLLSARPGLRPEQIKRILISSAVGLGPAGWNPNTGFGVINALRAHSTSE